MVLHTDKPWHGPDQPNDRTEEIARSFRHAEFIRLPWQSEHEQRNWGLARLYDYDYVLIVDADELYTRDDQDKLLNEIGIRRRTQDNEWCYRVPNVKTYFKRLDLVFDPPDSHWPIVAVDPKKVLFKEVRIPTSTYQIPVDITMHHLSYVKSDLKIWHKMQQFEHHDQVGKDWFDRVWMNFHPDMDNVRPYGRERSRLVGYSLPDELRKLL